MFMVNFLNPKLCFLQFIIRVLCLFLQIFSKAILKKKMRLFTGHIFCWNNSSYLTSIFRHSNVHDTGPPIRCLFNKQYLFTFNHRCSGCWWQYLTRRELKQQTLDKDDWKSSVQFITIGWRSINSEAEKCWL